MKKIKVRDKAHVRQLLYAEFVFGIKGDQYRAFGVPRLGFKRGLADDLVVSLYASLLALSLRPREVARNLGRLGGDRGS